MATPGFAPHAYQQQQQQQQYQQQQQQQQQSQVDDDSQKPIYVDTQHDDMIHDAQLDYYGCKLATCSSDRTVKIFNVTSNGYTPNTTLQSHQSGPIWEVSWSHPKFGSVLASCSFDGSVFIHRERATSDWILLSSHQNLHESSVNSVSFAPHEYGLVLAAGSSDGMVSVLIHREDSTWSVEKFRDNGLGVNSVSWAPYCDDQKDYMRLVTGGCDNQIRFWRKALSDADQTWEVDPDAGIGGDIKHTDWVRDVAWAPGIVGDEMMVASCSEDGRVIIWRKKTSESVWNSKLLHRFEFPVWRLSWSVTGNVLAVSSGEGDVSLWKQMLDGSFKKVSTVEGNSTDGDAPGQQ